MRDRGSGPDPSSCCPYSQSAWNWNSPKVKSKILHSPGSMLRGILMYKTEWFHPPSYIRNR
jgi:hypothetical protein